MEKQEITLEMALKELNEIISKMDQQEIPLEESFELYNQGIKLVEYCNSKIEKVEKEIKVI